MAKDVTRNRIGVVVEGCGPLFSVKENEDDKENIDLMGFELRRATEREIFLYHLHGKNVIRENETAKDVTTKQEIIIACSVVLGFIASAVGYFILF